MLALDVARQLFIDLQMYKIKINNINVQDFLVIALLLNLQESDQHNWLVLFKLHKSIMLPS